MKVIKLSCLLFLSGCGLFCGKPNEKQSALLEAAQQKFDDYCVVENIPCEPYYLNIKLKQEEDSSLTSKLHKALYNEVDKAGWISLHIYDAQGDFLITHHKDGKRSKVAPSW